MKLLKATSIVIPVFTIILEILPSGAVLNFASPDSEPIRSTFSYFDLTPFGYANFGPFLAAVLSCVALLVAILYAIVQKKALKRLLTTVSAIAFVASLLPLLFGLSCYSFIGAAISVLLFIETIASVLLPPKNSEQA